jgi:hypothetical protein
VDPEKQMVIIMLAETEMRFKRGFLALESCALSRPASA